MTSRLIASGVVTVLLLAGSVSAHHNMSAIFDFNNRVAFTGTLAKFDWRNPHIELVVDVKEGQRVTTWRIEGPAPGFFRDRDVSKADFEGAFGKEGTVTYCGRSQVADPRGELVALAPDAAEAAIVAELDLAIIRQQRKQEPTFRALRPELYDM